MSDDSLSPTLDAATATATLDAVSDPVFVFDAAGVVQYWNAAASDATGYGDEEFAGATLSELLEGVSVDRLRDAADDGTDTLPEAVLAAARGEGVAVELRVSSVAAGEADRFVVVTRELPAEKHVTDDRQGILDRMTDAFFALDEEWRLTYVNDQASEVLTAAMADPPDGSLEGLTLWEAIPDAVDTVFYEQYHEALASQEPVSFEAYYDPLDAWLAVRAYPSPTGLSVYFRDVTERHEQEDALREREETLREVHDITSDTERSFEEQVNALLDLGIEALGASSGALSRIDGEVYEFQAVRGTGDTEPGDTAPLSATNCERTAAEEQTLVMADIARDAPELTEKAGYAEWGISCYLGAPVFVDGDVHGTFCFYGEEPRETAFSEWEVTLVELLSQWVGYELTRRHTRKRLEDQNEKLDQFASIVSHDLRNPLNVLDGYLELAEETGDAEHFQQCRDTIDRMEALVDDLLSMARAGEGVEEVAPTGLDDAVRNAWETVETANASLVVDADVTIRADADRLRQLLVNLFRNSVEHAGPDVTVTVGTLDDGFYVEDDGPGIPAGEHEDVFDAGYSTAASGTGFGLSIVTDVAEAHGWTVSLANGESGGARFEFTGVEEA
ncbi:ATPase [Halobacterium sp. DL1]|nr:ATPase [Halobacterium sp. DL1]